MSTESGEDQINKFASEKYRAVLAKESERFQEAFNRLARQMTVAEKVIERIRHNLGGHVSTGGIKKVLRDMPFDCRGLLQDGKISGRKRYKFVGDIVLRMMLPDVPEERQVEELDNLLKETSKLIPVFRTIDDIFAIYIEDRRLTL